MKYFLSILLLASSAFSEPVMIHPSHRADCPLESFRGPLPIEAYQSHAMVRLNLPTSELSESETEYMLLLPAAVGEFYGEEITLEQLQLLEELGEEAEATALAVLTHPSKLQPEYTPSSNWNPLIDEPIQVIDGVVHDLSYSKFRAQMNFVLPLDAFENVAEGRASAVDHLEVALSFAFFVPAAKSLTSSFSQLLRARVMRVLLRQAILQREAGIRAILRGRGIEDIYSPRFLEFEIGKPFPNAKVPEYVLRNKTRIGRFEELGLKSKQEFRQEALRIARSTNQNKVSYRHSNGQFYIFDGDSNRLLVIDARTNRIRTLIPYKLWGAPEGLPAFRDPLERFLVRFLNDRRARPLYPPSRTEPIPIREFILGPEHPSPEMGRRAIIEAFSR